MLCRLYIVIAPDINDRSQSEFPKSSYCGAGFEYCISKVECFNEQLQIRRSVMKNLMLMLILPTAHWLRVVAVTLMCCLTFYCSSKDSPTETETEPEGPPREVSVAETRDQREM